MLSESCQNFRQEGTAYFGGEALAQVQQTGTPRAARSSRALNANKIGAPTGAGERPGEETR